MSRTTTIGNMTGFDGMVFGARRAFLHWSSQLRPIGGAGARHAAGLATATLASALLFGACPALAQDLTFLDPAGPIARSELDHFWRIALISSVAVLPVLLLLPLIVWRYRAGGKGAFRPNWDYSRQLEITMWGVPIVIVAILSVQLVRNTLELDPYRPLASDVPPLQVDVVALNWKWLFLLPEYGIASVDSLTIPVDRPVEFRLTSDSTMQSFMVPALAGQIYVMPGMETRQNLLADRQGLFVGRNTQFNGPGFAGQSFALQVTDTAGFEGWVSRLRQDGPVMDEAAYALLATPGTAKDLSGMRWLALDSGGAFGFAAYPDGLFDRVRQRYMTQLPVGPAEQPGSPNYAPEGARQKDSQHD
ncbi:MAG: cytochrome o ubiquinol oxidase subunit II [Rhodobacteraceae bacterium]|nr:MAG: cytochrome o ubiquinol oxidase subunit II [Paracoccaceae bacterium]